MHTHSPHAQHSRAALGPLHGLPARADVCSPRPPGPEEVPHSGPVAEGGRGQGVSPVPLISVIVVVVVVVGEVRWYPLSRSAENSRNVYSSPRGAVG